MARSSNEVRSKSELPKWFVLEKYSGAKAFGSEEWLSQLAVRRVLLSAVGMPSWNQAEIGSQRIYGDLELIRSSPLIDEKSLKSILRVASSCYLSVSFGVSRMTVGDLYFEANTLTEEQRNQGREAFESVASVNSKLFRDFFNNKGTLFRFNDAALSPDDLISLSVGASSHGTESARSRSGVVVGIAPTVPHKRVYKSALIKPVGTYLNIDLSLPDKLLIDQFSVLLKELRMARPCPKINNFNAWVRSAVLPYLDLEIWAKETGVLITNKLMADAIFPNGEGGEEDVRKTTKKYAKELLSDKKLHLLASIASIELAENYKK